MSDKVSHTDSGVTDPSEGLFDAALAKWGYDGQLLALAQSCSDLSSTVCRFVSHRLNGQTLAAGAAEAEIMLEHLRHNGMNYLISQQKTKGLQRLAARLKAGAPRIRWKGFPSAACLKRRLSSLRWPRHFTATAPAASGCLQPAHAAALPC